jgi:hypothetical protein
MFPTQELANARAKELRQEKYRKDIRQRELTEEEYLNTCVLPCKRSAEISEEYRNKLLAA